jgi:hypothetical protein
MKYFRELGLTLGERWRAVDYDDAAFADIATKAFEERPPAEHVTLEDLVEWVHTTDELVPQRSSEQFGQPPITVFSAPRYYIEALFWVDGTTLIHQHGFSGAFHVLHGSSIEASYAFREERRFGSHMLAGDLTLRGVERLTKGATRPIVAGMQGTVHALFHLDRPSVSIVARTHLDPFAGPQYCYSRAGLGFNPFYKPPALSLQEKTLDVLHTMGHPDFERRARDTIRRADSFTARHLLTHLVDRITPYERYLDFLESVLPAHRDLVPMMRDVAEEHLREANITALRESVRAPEHRFFLALLLNCPTRASIVDMITRAFPDRDPIDAITTWVTELSEAEGDELTRAAGRLDRAGIVALDALLRSSSTRGALGRMADVFGADEVRSQEEDLVAMFGAIRGSIFYRPLFTV